MYTTKLFKENKGSGEGEQTIVINNWNMYFNINTNPKSLVNIHYVIEIKEFETAKSA